MSSNLPRWSMQLSERRVVLAFGDVCMALSAWLVAIWLWTFTSDRLFSIDYIRLLAPWLLVLLPVWLALNLGNYNLKTAAHFQSTFANLLFAGLVLNITYSLIFFFAPPNVLPRLVIIYFSVLAVLLCGIWRLAYIRLLSAGHFQTYALIVGAGWAGKTILEAIQAHQSHQYRVFGIIDDDSSKHNSSVLGVPVLGDHQKLHQLIKDVYISEIILAITGQLSPEMFHTLLECHAAGIDIVRMPVLFEYLTGQIPIQHLPSDWILTSYVDAVRLNDLSRLGRRLLDLVGAVVGLSLFACILPILAIAIWLDSGGPIFYSQTRIGRANRPFVIHKLRTMVTNAESNGEARWATGKQDPRITRVGKFLRRTRLDELPQFWNVLHGEMSLVGPRPERPEFIDELEKQIPFYRSRLLVKPGLTGWAQICYDYGGTLAGTAIKLQYDLYYIKHRSFWFDVWILLRTVATVLRFKGT
jgi:exopolysaccharide biosynthesis polyprenyl glycosylphosphotransferase